MIIEAYVGNAWWELSRGCGGRTLSELFRTLADWKGIYRPAMYAHTCVIYLSFQVIWHNIGGWQYT